LGIGFGERLYVTDIDPTENVVRLGTKKDLLRTDFILENTSWMIPPGHPLRNGLTVQIRSRHRAAPAEVSPLDGGRARVQFHSPQSAVAPGQAAVFYHDDLLVGGGWISRSIPTGDVLLPKKTDA
jgi:tRNA-specific 2-thiouridylase